MIPEIAGGIVSLAGIGGLFFLVSKYRRMRPGCSGWFERLEKSDDMLNKKIDDVLVNISENLGSLKTDVRWIKKDLKKNGNGK
jgi:hypothetical protein